MKLKPGQRVRITSEEPNVWDGWSPKMKPYLGNITTIKKNSDIKKFYFLNLEQPNAYYGENGWAWRERWLIPLPNSLEELERDFIEGRITLEEFEELKQNL